MRPNRRDLKRRATEKSFAVLSKLAAWMAWLLVVGMTPLVDGQTLPEAAQPQPTAMARLEYREVPFVPLSREVFVQPVTRFSDEPASTDTRLHRGLLLLGGETNAQLAFMWEVNRRTLHLDLNRNGNLTDDPSGVFTATNSGLQLFESIRLPFPSAHGSYQSLADVHVWETGEGAGRKPRIFLHARSLWDGSIALRGRAWYLALIDNFDGRIGPATSLQLVSDRLVVRPWEERDKACFWWHASLEDVHSLAHAKLITAPYRWAGNSELFDALNLPPKLFFRDHAYRLDCKLDAASSPARLVVHFSEIQATRGKLRIEGASVRRLVLDHGSSADGFTAVLDKPAVEVEVPTGSYPRQLVLLQHEKHTNTAVGIATNRLVVAEGSFANLKAGAPLRNEIEMEPNPGNGSLWLGYRLVNEAGIRFQMAWHDEQVPVRLMVRQDTNIVAQGKFTFG